MELINQIYQFIFQKIEIVCRYIKGVCPSLKNRMQRNLSFFPPLSIPQPH